MDVFLWENGWQTMARKAEVIEMALAVEADRWRVDEIETWLRQRVVALEKE